MRVQQPVNIVAKYSWDEEHADCDWRAIGPYVYCLRHGSRRPLHNDGQEAP